MRRKRNPNLSRRNAINSSGSEITSKAKLAVTLRWLAGGSYLDLCFTWGIALGSFYQDGGVLWGTMEILDEILDIGMSFNDHSQLRNMAMEFSKYSNARLTNRVLAIDGWVCRTRCPRANEVRFPTCYYNRKGFYGLVDLVSCDAHLKFRMFCFKYTGCTNDNLAWILSDFKRWIDDGLLHLR